MSQKTIGPEDTIADVVPLLGNWEAYISQVLQTMHEMRRAHGDVVVRIGITGTGSRPSYRIDRTDTGETIAAYDAQTREPYQAGVDSENWSLRSMTLDEVAQLLGSLRSVKKAGGKIATRT